MASAAAAVSSASIVSLRRTTTAAAAAAAAAASGRGGNKKLLTATTAAATVAVVDVDKVSARVFCGTKGGGGHGSGGGGGNPLTIFSDGGGGGDDRGDRSLLWRRLARTCEWESAMVVRRSSGSKPVDVVAFYLPTGEPVRFCAHAAMGAAVAISSSSSQGGEEKQQEEEKAKDVEEGSMKVCFKTVDGDRLTATVLREEDGGGAAAVVSLDVSTPVRIDPVEHPPTLFRVLRDALGIKSGDLTSRTDPFLPTFVNASVMGRPKTLVCVESTEILHNANPPFAVAAAGGGGGGSSAAADAFRIACDALGSTGIYLYAPLDDEHDDDGILLPPTFECRQFPRASGYPEDPATGVAAAALAVALHHRPRRRGQRQQCSEYRFHQGTAMGKPSRIVVRDVSIVPSEGGHDGSNKNEGDGAADTAATATFRLTGAVEVDRRETIEVLDDHSLE